MEVDNSLVEEFKDLAKENVEFAKKCSGLSQEITSGQLSIVKLVEQLGPLLVNTSPESRELGTCILTQVLEGLPLNHFDRKQLEFICNFYADRLKDHHQVIPAVLSGILALAKFEQFPDGAASQILTALFRNVSCQQQQEQDRQKIYNIFDALLNKCGSELCTMGMDYVYGIISAVDGERNPKNLILLFNWFPKFLRTVTLGHLTEEAFEVLACYFPVDFKTPTHDPTNITRDQLANSLAPCLTAIPQFSEYCFPLALEKLESSLEIAKLDSLKLLEIGCENFTADSYIQLSTEIWSQIQREIFNRPSAVVENACLSTLTVLIRKISNDPMVNGTVKDISDTLKGNLLPDSKLFEPSSKLLLSVSKASRRSSDIVTKEIVPILINTFNITTSSVPRVVILGNLIKFFDSYVNFHDRIEFEEVNTIPVLCIKATLDENNSLRQMGFEGLAQICQFLLNDVRSSLFDHLQKLILLPQANNVRKSILKCFDKLAINFPSEVNQLIDNIEISDAQSLEGYLEALCVIMSRDFFTDTVINIFLNYLQKEANLAQIVINYLKVVLVEHESNDKIQSILIEKDLISKLIDWYFSEEDKIGDKCLDSLAFILKSIIGYQTTEKQTEIVLKELAKLKLIKSTRIFILDGILCRLRRDVRIDYKILNDITELSVKEDNDIIKNRAVELLANLVNKCSDEDILQGYLGQFGENQTDVTLMTWITKALVMRNHVLANIWIDRLINLLDKEKNCASSFRVIMNDNFDCLSTKSYCLRTLLYQQKFFTLVSNKLSENYRPGRTSYLVAIGYLLENTPKKAILLQFNKLLKLIILCLDECQEDEVLEVILQVIMDFIVNKEKCIEDHLSDFLTRFLKLSTFDKSMKIRVIALQCLKECTNFPIYKLLIHKQEVLTVLGKVVDDKKRIVRKEAVETRSLWFLLDAPM